MALVEGAATVGASAGQQRAGQRACRRLAVG
jgi:hypothetical protein